MYKNLLIGLLSLCVASSCRRNSPTINVVCEENEVGNCVIKWDAPSSMKGYVKIYSSLSPNAIAEKTPIGMAPIAEGKLVIIPQNPTQRLYYAMVFNNTYRVKVATRNINIPGIQNFRDIGGYPSTKEILKTRWGMIYRSAKIDRINAYQLLELKNIGIRTIIDLRTPEELKDIPPLGQPFRVIHIPIASGNIKPVVTAIREGDIKSDSIQVLLKQVNQELVTNYRQEVKQLFTLLCDSTNYPVVISCSTGKERTGAMIALLLAALDVDENSILNDYELSNDYFDVTKVSEYAYKLPPKSQEAITAIYSAKREYINAARELIESKYGSFKAYLQKEIGLSKQQLKDLQNILLEP